MIKTYSFFPSDRSFLASCRSFSNTNSILFWYCFNLSLCFFNSWNKMSNVNYEWMFKQGISVNCIYQNCFILLCNSTSRFFFFSKNITHFVVKEWDEEAILKQFWHFDFFKDFFFCLLYISDGKREH